MQEIMLLNFSLCSRYNLINKLLPLKAVTTLTHTSQGWTKDFKLQIKHL